MSEFADGFAVGACSALIVLLVVLKLKGWA